MATSERDRHDLYDWFRENAGEARADTMTDLLPPTGWGDVATRRDLDDLRREFKADLRAEIGAVRLEISEQMRRQTVTLCSVFILGMTLVVAAIGLLA